MWFTLEGTEVGVRMLPALQRISEPQSSSLAHHKALTDSSGTFQALSEMRKITAAEVKDISRWKWISSLSALTSLISFGRGLC